VIIFRILIAINLYTHVAAYICTVFLFVKYKPHITRDIFAIMVSRDGYDL